MSQIELSYEDMKQEMIKEIQKHQFVVLATSEGESVTARSMLLISNGLKIFFMTNPNYRKYNQIMANPNVAIAAGNLQIEGVASLKGHPLDEENAEYIKAFKDTQPDFYERSTRVNFKRPDVRVIEVVPKRIALYTSGDMVSGAEPYIDILNTVKEEAHRVTRSAASDAPAYRE